MLLHAQPILTIRQNWSSRDDQEAGYDPLCLSMRLFDVIIDQSGFLRTQIFVLNVVQ